jgi:hypothetical protein
MAVMNKTPPKKVRHEVYRNPGSPVAKRVKDFLSRMTLEEKAAEMMCVWQQKADTLVNADGDFDLPKAKTAFKHKRGLAVTNTGKREGTEVIQMYIRDLGELSDASGQGTHGISESKAAGG